MNKQNTSNTVLSQAQLKALLRSFIEEQGGEYHLSRIGFFGSYVRNQATAESDVDIIFETDRPNLLETVGIKQDLEKLLGRPVDVIRLHSNLRPNFRARIEREAIYV